MKTWQKSVTINKYKATLKAELAWEYDIKVKDESSRTISFFYLNTQ